MSGLYLPVLRLHCNQKSARHRHRGVIHPLDRHVLGRSDTSVARARAAWRTRWSRSATFVARRAASAYAAAAAGRSPSSSCRCPRTACHRWRSPITSRKPVRLAQPGAGTEDMADRDRAAEHRGGVPAHRVLCQRDEVVVPGEDLRPVGLLGARRVVVQGGDRRLDLVAARAPILRLHGERRLQDANALGDLARVPQAAVLPVERDDPALGIEPRRHPGVVQEHQREQPAGLRLLRGEGELAGEPDRLGGKVHPARVARRVDEVEHAQHDGEVAGLVQAAPAEGALGAADPLRHRRLGDVEGVGDLLGGEAADGAQGQRHLGRGREVGVTAAEQQEEGVVALLRGGRPRLRVLGLLAALPGGLAAAGVDEPPRRDRGQPRARVARRVLGPDPERLEQRLLERILGGVEVLAPADQACEHPRDEGAQRALVQSPGRCVDHAVSVLRRRAGHDLPDFEPLVQGLSARAGLGGHVGRELERALVRLDIDHVPARYEIAGLGQRPVGGDRRGVRAAVAHPGPGRRERLRVDALAALLEQLVDVPLEGDVRLHVLGVPLVHRREGMMRLRAAAVVLEEQVLRHRGLLVSWAAPVEALHPVSGAGRRFSTSCRD